MYDSRRSRYSRSPDRRSISRSLSRSPSRSRSRSCDSSDAENPGNNLYVTGLSSRVTKDVLGKHFGSEGKVTDVHHVVDPRTRESRGFGFVTMATVEDADRCIKYLHRSVLEGRIITVEKARRGRGRTPTPGRYLGVRTIREHRRSPSYSPYHRRYSSSERERSYSPYYRRHRSPSWSPCYRRHGPPYYSRYDCSPARRRHRRSYSRDSRSCSRSISPFYRRPHRRSLSRSASPRLRRRSYSRSVTPVRRSYRRSCSRSISPRRSSRRYSPIYSPVPRSSKRGPSRCFSHRRSSSGYYSRESYSHSRSSMSSRSRSASRSSSPSARDGGFGGS